MADVLPTPEGSSSDQETLTRTQAHLIQLLEQVRHRRFLEILTELVTLWQSEHEHP
jgi:hypothetical protein